MKIEKTVLANGATILGVNLPDYNSVTISFGFKTGSRTEPVELSGMSHFLEHMLFKGSQKRPSTEIFSREADAIGAQYNAFTGKEYTVYHIKSNKEYFTQALDMVGDMVTNPLLEQKELEKERGTILEELKLYQDNPMLHLPNFMEATLYGDNELGREIIGTIESIGNIQSDNMRSYYKEHYNQKNVAVAVVGNLPSDYISQVSKYLEAMPDGLPTKWSKVTFSQNEKVGILEKNLEQANIGLMIPGVSIQEEDQYPLQVAAAILGGYMSARLFSEIREKRGWAYRIWAFNDTGYDSGYIGVYGGVKNEKVVESLSLIKEMLLSFSRDVTEEEVNRAIGNAKGSASIKQEATDEIATDTLLHFLLTGKVHTPEEEAQRLSKVTMEEVQKVAKTYFTPDKVYLAVIGPFKDREKFVKILAD